MIIMTISNWRKKLKLVLLTVLLAVLAASALMLLQLGEAPEVGADNDRDVNGSLKVEASPSVDTEEAASNGWEELLETIKVYYQK